MKNQNKSGLMDPLIYIAIGAVLIIYPTIVGVTVCYILSGAAFAMGIAAMIGYFMTGVETRVTGSYNGLAKGIILILLGIFILIKKDLIISIVPLILGFMITVNGIKGIQTAVNLKKVVYGNFKVNITVASIISVFGIVMMLNPFSTVKVLFTMIGMGLLVSGIADMVASMALNRQIKKAKEN